MPHIPISFDGVETFENLPVGEYLGSIDKVEYHEADAEDKSDQVRVTYIVIDGDFIGRKQTEFLSMSERALFRLKQFFDKFGLAEDFAGIEVDEDSNQVIEPDLVGVNVVFRVYKDTKKYNGEFPVRTQLKEVTSDSAAATPAGAAPAKRQFGASKPASGPARRTIR